MQTKEISLFGGVPMSVKSQLQFFIMRRRSLQVLIYRDAEVFPLQVGIGETLNHEFNTSLFFVEIFSLGF